MTNEQFEALAELIAAAVEFGGIQTLAALNGVRIPQEQMQKAIFRVRMSEARLRDLLVVKPDEPEEPDAPAA